VEGDPNPTPERVDRALVLGELPEQKGLAVLRQRGEGAPVEAGVVRSVREGESIVGELVTLKPTSEGSRLCDVEVHVDARPASHHGPARVASNAYRSGWDEVFGKSSLN
jgi:hypothetical protein